MSEKNNARTITIAIILCIALFAVFSIIALNVENIDMSTVPNELVPYIEALQWIFTAAPIAIAFAGGRGIYGYAVKWLQMKRTGGDEAVDFSLQWLTETMAKFEGFIVVVTPVINMFVGMLPPEQKQLAMVITASLWALISILFSEIKRIVADVRA